MKRIAFAAIAILLGCQARTSANVVDSGPATTQRVPPSSGEPAYIQAVFHGLDSLLTKGERDSLRALSLDSAFDYRTHRLAPRLDPVIATWIRSPAGDTVRAHGESLPGVMSIVFLDLYQQHLRAERFDLAGALRRISHEYVSAIGATTRIDTVLLATDVDGSGHPDQLVRESRTKMVDSMPVVIAQRLALFIDATASIAVEPTWATKWNDADGLTAGPALTVSGGEGSLILAALDFADGTQATVIHARHGVVREVLHHQVDSGEGDFSMREVDHRIVIDATGTVDLVGREVKPKIQCTKDEWPGVSLVFDASKDVFVLDRSICMQRR